MNQTKIKGKETRLYSACRGSNLRPQIQGCTQALLGPSRLHSFKENKHYAVHTAHARVTYGTRAQPWTINTPQTCPSTGKAELWRAVQLQRATYIPGILLYI